jgi:hypothetical protein
MMEAEFANFDSVLFLFTLLASNVGGISC